MKQLAQKHASTVVRHAKRFTSLRSWLRGLIRAPIEGGTSAVIALTGTNFVGEPIDFKQAAIVALSGAALRLVLFLNSNPLPEEQAPITNE